MVQFLAAFTCKFRDKTDELFVPSRKAFGGIGQFIFGVAELCGVFSQRLALNVQILAKGAAKLITEMVEATVGIFGADRCMFGSNFPVEKIWCRYVDLFASFRAATSKLSQAENDAIFNDTAARVYRL